MQQARRAFLWLLLVFTGVAAAWYARGAYDQYFMIEVRFHVIYLSQLGHEINLEIPSGKKKNFRLKPDGVFDFVVSDTGEGSIKVTIDGNSREPVGYVTSMNSIIVLTINEDYIGFSQIFPSLPGRS